MPSDSKFTRDDDGNVAVRVVSNTGVSEQPESMFAKDEDGNVAVRVVFGEGGGGSVDEDRIIIKSAEIPAASEDELGKFYCYSGVTNQNYTHGYVYECIAVSTSYEANIVYPRSTFASEDFYKAGQLIVDAGVADPMQVVSGSMTYDLAGTIWSIIFKDSDGNALNTAFSLYTEDLESEYDILPVIDPSEFVDGQVIDFSVASVIPHANYTWTRVNLQPGSEHDLGFFDTVAELQAAHPTGTAGDFALIGATDTFWVWDTTTSTWVDSHKADAVTSVNGQTGAVTLGINDVAPTQTDKSGYVLGTDGFVAGWVKPEIVQRSALPQASEEEVNKIYQYVGTTDANYTNGYFYKCVSDGQDPATYSWENIEVQEVDTLPSQTGNSGKFLTTDGTNTSWSDKPLVNKTTGSQSLNILGNTQFNPSGCVLLGDNSFSLNANSVAVGTGAQNTGGENVSIGYAAQAREARSVAIGYNVHAWSSRSIAIGGTVPANASGAMQFGGGQTNSDSGTVKFGLTADGGATYTNYILLNNDGTIPTDRFTTTPVADGTYVPTVSISSGVATRSWTTPASAPVVPATMPELTVVGWSSNTQTVNVTGVTANNIVFVSPAPASAADYASAGIVCTAQGAGTLTFTCTTTPTNAITVNVVILG